MQNPLFRTLSTYYMFPASQSVDKKESFYVTFASNVWLNCVAVNITHNVIRIAFDVQQVQQEQRTNKIHLKQVR